VAEASTGRNNMTIKHNNPIADFSLSRDALFGTLRASADTRRSSISPCTQRLIPSFSTLLQGEHSNQKIESRHSGFGYWKPTVPSRLSKGENAEE
jgi:hypothetical protein